MVDATIIAVRSSTKNASAIRDPKLKQTREGRECQFGTKLHIGADQRGIVHTVRAIAASVAAIMQPWYHSKCLLMALNPSRLGKRGSDGFRHDLADSLRTSSRCFSRRASKAAEMRYFSSRE
jgi:hypothetical protein